MKAFTLTEDHALQAYQYTLDGTSEEGGTVDSPVGWFALVPPGVLDGGGVEGWVVVEQDSDGRISGTEFDTEVHARKNYEERLRLFGEWDSQEDW